MSELNQPNIAALAAKAAEATATLQAAQSAQKGVLVASLLRQMQEGGVTAADLQRGNKARRGVVPAKYRHPFDPQITWAGRGKRPAWVTSAVKEGLSLESLLIAPVAA